MRTICWAIAGAITILGFVGPVVAGDWRNRNDRYKSESAPDERLIMLNINKHITVAKEAQGSNICPKPVVSVEGKLEINKNTYQLYVMYKSKKSGQTWANTSYVLYKLDTGFWVIKCDVAMYSVWEFVMKD